jgi:hypothetical protein
MFALLIAISEFTPLYYGLPLDLGIGDIVPAIAGILLLLGGFLALFRRYSSILIAGWSWSLAVRVSGVVFSLAHPRDFSAALAKVVNPENRAGMRQLMERGDQVSLDMQLAFVAVALVGLILALLGTAEGRVARRADAA